MRGSADPVAVAAAFAEVTSVGGGPHTGADLGQRLVDVAVDLLDLWAAGMLLEAPGSSPQVLAASSHETAFIESVQVESGQGPCLAAMARDALVVVHDVAEVAREWPDWYAGARRLGVQSAYGVPIRSREGTFAALNLFLREGPLLTGADLAVVSSLAAVAGTALLTQQAVAEVTTRAGQLQSALDSRVLVEQAKGRLAERRGIAEDEAFALLRARSRASRRPISDVARGVLEGTEPPFA